MESGLEDRNNPGGLAPILAPLVVSMESGLEDRNNLGVRPHRRRAGPRLNGVRPRRPEQSPDRR